ncbi:hypothetical protein ANCCEY_08115 [Ancylostoma ceylanicum]|uniref:Uncharacterized protein n=1 Tax=Ancylostoma ceylanicum TaxID=53326 RepID=A0A0D6LLJ5_9BILA|nr:hypothetical protein ANCCEY_08115 [Ancylostoma ceylanicum]
MISCILLESYVETLDDAALAHKLSKCKFSDPSTVHGCFQHKGTTTCTCTKLSACFADEEILVDENGSTSMSKNEMYCLRLRWNKKRDDTTPRTFVLSSSRTVAKNISKEEERRLRDPVLPRQTEDMRSSTTVDWWDFLDQLGKKSKTKEEETRTRTTEAMTETTAESTTEATEGTSSSTAESTAEATITETTLDSTTEATEGTSSSTAEENKIQRRIDVREIKSIAGQHIIKKKKKQGMSKEGSAEGTKSAEGDEKPGKQKPKIGSAETSRTKQSGSKEKGLSGSKEKGLSGSGEKAHDGGDYPSQPAATGGGAAFDPYTGATIPKPASGMPNTRLSLLRVYP